MSFQTVITKMTALHWAGSRVWIRGDPWSSQGESWPSGLTEEPGDTGLKGGVWGVSYQNDECHRSQEAPEEAVLGVQPAAG